MGTTADFLQSTVFVFNKVLATFYYQTDTHVNKNSSQKAILPPVELPYFSLQGQKQPVELLFVCIRVTIRADGCMLIIVKFSMHMTKKSAYC